MAHKLSTTITLLALVLASIFAVTFSTLPQSWVLVLLLPVTCYMAFKLFASNTVLKGAGLIWFIIIGVIYTVIRACLSLSQDLAMQDIFVLAAFVFGFLIAFGVESKSNFENRFLQVVCGLVFLNLFMFIPFLNEQRDSLLGYAHGEWNTGLFNHRNFFGNFMAVSSCVLISKFLFTKGKSKTRWMCLLAGSGAAVAVFAAMARGAVIGLLAGLAIIVIWSFISKEKKVGKISKRFQSGILIGSLLFAIVGANWVFEKRDKSVAGDVRINYYSMAIDQVEEAPFIGSGSRSVEYKSYRNWHPRLYGYIDFKFSHNEFIQVVADYGIIGLLLMMCVTGSYLFVLGVSIYQKIITGEGISIEVAGLSCTAVMAINSFVSFPLHAFPNMLLFGVIFGLSLSQRAQNQRSISNDKHDSLLLKFGICGSVGLLITYTAPSVVKEAVASVYFIEQGLVIDDANWVIENNGSSNWEVALFSATQISSSYSRENKLGHIYLHKFEQSGDKSFLDKAESRYSKAKDRHSEDPISRLNLANVYKLKGDFERSIKEYEEVMPMVIRRDEIFNTVLKLIEVELLLAANKTDKKENLEAMRLLNSALDKCRAKFNSGRSRTVRLYDVYETALLQYCSLLSYKAGESEKAIKYSLIKEYIHLSQKRSSRTQSANLIRSCEYLNALAHEMWVQNRDPQGAINVLYYSRRNLHRVRTYNSNIEHTPSWIQADQEMEQMRGFLQRAGFKAKAY